ncbi:glycosyltransferase family 4 protein [Phocaeicola sartorii]|uniref:glycosyltransferase family 4 protein n=1 Tax=Phocaeicola sartorii TaxID=671267 RepID=UPI001F56D8D1|nr:glycosyltransferase family 1 protein [Phocaeicola sartorii]
MARLAINGQFAARRMTGQERFAYEIVKELDRIVKPQDQVELIVPLNASNIPPVKNIKLVKYGEVRGTLWEQTYFTYYVFRHKAISLNLCSVMPVLKPGIICIHDLSYKVNSTYFKTRYARISQIWHKFQYWLAWHFSPIIYTVSEYSKSQMIDLYRVDPKRITVVGNGWEHFKCIKNIELKNEFFELLSKPYFFSLGSLAPNKNIEWVLSVAKTHSQYNFLIAGKSSLKAYGISYKECDYSNVKFLGYISDEEIKYLMRNCKAFIFPSFFEGFGIPPLEALSVGAKIIVAKSSCLPEIFGTSAYYIDPYDSNVDLDELLSGEVCGAENVLEKYTFEKSANIIIETLSSRILPNILKK